MISMTLVGNILPFSNIEAIILLKCQFWNNNYLFCLLPLIILLLLLLIWLLWYFSNFSHFITNIMLYQFIVDYCYQYLYLFIVDYSIVLLPLSNTTTSAVAVAVSISIIFLFNQANRFQIANSNTITFIYNILTILLTLY